LEEERIYTAGSYPIGEYRDVLLGRHNEVIWERDWERNLIVDGLRKLLAALVKGDNQGAPIAWWAVGTGDDAWDQGSVPADATRRTFAKLVKETARKPVAQQQIKFFGGTFTNQLEVSQDFVAADIPGGPLTWRLREFGLFAGGSAAADSGVLINHRIHPRIDLQSGFTLKRTLRLTF
jgi:hypothetical protein